MNDLMLIEPTVDLEKEYLDMLDDWQRTGEKLVPFVLEFSPANFPDMIKKLQDCSLGIGIPDGFTAHTTYWLINQEKQILGVTNIRHRLTESLFRYGGLIGYGIRPSERRRGYATQILRLALEKAKIIGIEKALVNCDKDNTGSARTIIKNGGYLDSEELIDGVIVQRYWIQL